MWSEHARSNGHRFHDPLTVAAHPPQVAPMVLSLKPRLGFWDVATKVSILGWVIVWFAIAVGSAALAWQDHNPKWLWLTSTASANVFAYKLTGKSWREVQKAFRAIAKPIPYVVFGAVAAGGVWLSLHFDEPDILTVTLFVALVGLLVSWVFTN